MRYGDAGFGNIPFGTTATSRGTSITSIFNPVKHGLVSRVQDWPHSSFHRYVRDELLPQDWAGSVKEGGAGFGERNG